MTGALPTVLPSDFTTEYHKALEEYLLSDSGEEALMSANNLGRCAVNEHCNILDLVALHQRIVLQAVLEAGTEEERGLRLGRGEAFLAEVMAPFEMMHRGFHDTIRQLQQVNVTLEKRVEERTRALQESQSKTADLARLYHILSSINSAIVRLQNPDELFGEACRIAVEQGGYRSAWVRLKKGGDWQLGDIRCSLESGRVTCEKRSAQRLALLTGNDLDQVFREGEPVVRHDAEVAQAAPGDHVPERCSYALFPLLIEEEVVGVFSLFSTESEAFTTEEMRLLLELAGDLSFALDHIQKEKQLKYLAYYDPLTGLPNLSLLLEHLPLQFREASRVGDMVALLMVDLVNFSKMNDTYGRHVGDKLLKLVGERLSKASGNREMVARVGPDCFGVTLTGLAETSQVAHRLEEEVLNCFTDAFTGGDKEFHLAVKVGVSLFPTDGSTPEVLYKNTEMALKLAKRKKELYLFYNRGMNERIVQSVTMELKLRRALEEGKLLLNYQPKFAVTDKHIDGMEALVRCADPEEGMILPSRFIPLMEETGMVVEIGKWVLRRVVRDLQNWRRLELDPPRIAVNVSPIQLRRKDFIDSLLEILPTGEKDHGLDLEITESAVMDDVAENIPKLQAVRELGFGIAIDDFGTGYSSLSYLGRLPVNTLKIDRSFIIDMTERPNSLALVSTIITLAHSLDLKVVAEGVDREEQAKLLRLLRCDLIQGNLYSPPLPEEQVTEFLRSRQSAGH